MIPDQITAIAPNAFQRSTIENITFHKGLSSIGDYAFEGCPNLNNVKILNGTTNLGDYAFANCIGLSAFTFEEIDTGVPYDIGTHFFDGCSALTQVILPNRLSTGNRIPDYMFANSGIVHAVIPARITYLASTGVFYNCKQMEIVVFEAKKLETGSAPLGAYFFYGCSKLKELVIPPGMQNKFASNYAFANCTSLEKLVIYVAGSYSLPVNLFEGCSSLKAIEMWNVDAYEYDEEGNIIGYSKLSPTSFTTVNPGAFKGLTALKYINLCNKSLAFDNGGIFAGSNLETIVLPDLNRAAVPATFSGTKNLKNVWISAGNSLYFSSACFTELETDINFYFYDMTKEEVFARAGENWYNNADEKAHFYFKDTIPADVEWPEDIKPAT